MSGELYHENANKLNERIKELNGLHQIARVLFEGEISTREAMVKICEIVPQIYQYANLAKARITIDDQRYSTPGFREGPVLQKAKFEAGNHPGCIEVCYLCNEEEAEEITFAIEEQMTLHSVARLLKSFLEQKASHKLLEESKNSYYELFNNVGNALYVIDENGRFLDVNKSAEEMYGYPKEVFIGKTPEFISAEGYNNLPDTFDFIQKALNGEKNSFEWWGKRKDGTIFPKEVVLNSGFYFGKRVVIADGRDITEWKEREQLIKSINSNIIEGIYRSTPEGKILYANEAFARMFGHDSPKEMQEIVTTRLYADPATRSKILRKIARDRQVTNEEVTLKRKDGSEFEALVNINRNTDRYGNTYYDGALNDITKRKIIERQFEAERKKALDSLKEKEILLKEIHHRVKNNLAIINGLLYLQSQRIEDPIMRARFLESQVRIKSMALVHEKLYQSDSLSKISFQSYLQELTEQIKTTFIEPGQTIKTTVKSDEINLNITKAIPCGLLVNELISNAFQHGFKGIQKGHVSVVCKTNNGHILLSVCDNGKGIPKGFDIKNSKSLGLNLVAGLTEQIDGKIDIVPESKGTSFHLTFKP